MRDACVLRPRRPFVNERKQKWINFKHGLPLGYAKVINGVRKMDDIFKSMSGLTSLSL